MPSSHPSSETGGVFHLTIRELCDLHLGGRTASDEAEHIEIAAAEPGRVRRLLLKGSRIFAAAGEFETVAMRKWGAT
jgi:hypothetical protein